MAAIAASLIACARRMHASSSAVLLAFAAVITGPPSTVARPRSCSAAAQRHRHLVDGQRRVRRHDRLDGTQQRRDAVVELQRQAVVDVVGSGRSGDAPSGNHVQTCGVVTVGGDERDRAAVDRPRLVGRGDARARRVADVRLPEEQQRLDALRVHRVHEARVPLAPHAREVGRGVVHPRRAGRQRGRSYTATAFSPRILRCAASSSGARCSRSSSTTPAWYSGCG